jgi:hypothetical protein
VDAIRNNISGVKLLHLYLDIDYLQFESLQLKLVLKGLARLNPHCSKQARCIGVYFYMPFFLCLGKTVK